RDASMYLASTATGERVYLAKDVVDADFLITAGALAFDPVIGYRGTNSVLYPGLSMQEAMDRSLGQGHIEIGVDDPRPLRELIDEVGWLLGNPFSVQVIPAARHGASHVLAGVSDSVLAEGKKRLAGALAVQVENRPDVVVAAI